MNNFVLYEDILEKEKTASFIIATKELLKTLGNDIKTLKGANSDIGCDKIGINIKSFHINNAKTLALANKQKSDIVCIEDSSFLSLSLTKKKLTNDLELKNEINSKLNKDDLELNLDTKIYSLATYIQKKIGFDTITKDIKNSFDKFYASLYFGSFKCDLEQFYNLKPYEEILKITKLNLINYSLNEQSCGYEILNTKASLAFKMSGDIMLDMFDNAADFVVINDTRSFIMFDNYQKELEKSVNREINLPVFNISQIILMALGVIDKDRLGLQKHKIETEML